jgi:hypothetical protein
VAVPLYIEAAKGPTVGCRLVDTCCRYCHVATEVVIVVGAAAEAAAAEVLGSEVPALANKGRLWLVATLLV